MPPVVFEPAIPAIERPQTHALDRAAAGFGRVVVIFIITVYNFYYFNSDLSLIAGYVAMFIFCLVLHSCEICTHLRYLICSSVNLQLVKAVESARRPM
jgi:hypothetical protein